MSINEWKRKNKIGTLIGIKKRKEAKSRSEPQIFKLLGYDMFSREWYSLDQFSTWDKARKAGVKKLEELAISQPANSYGGQSINGIQDRVFIEHPNGKRYRVIG
jgi:hypothetical protein